MASSLRIEDQSSNGAGGNGHISPEQKQKKMRHAVHDLYQTVKKEFPDLQLQASGGVSVLNDLMELPANGVIIGKALYEGRFTLKQALEIVQC